ncbi:bile acid:sodium symporter family protein [Bacillus sp. 37MA]|uniref:bile acid:sodium symporter family protein n=1 Tax=Bacillus sp. 37MA TaxID=1132442 RepID=UPI00036AADE4|nr:bile acid:sodium symporter family protein [Bacillus sp. 37MA]
MLQLLNALLGKWMPILTPISVVTGIIAAEYLHSWVFIVPWLFAFMTFAGSVNSSFNMLHHTMTHPFPIVIALVTLHIVAPVWALVVGQIVFPHDPLTVTGITLALVIPTGITSMIWVTMYKGSVTLSLALILIDTMLSPIIVPFSLSVLVGSNVEMSFMDVMNGLFWMIVIPSLAGMGVNQWLKAERASRISQKLSPFSKLSLPVVVAINSSVIAPYMKNIDLELLGILVTIFLIVLSVYLFSWGIAYAFKQSKENTVAIIYTSGMRNFSAGAVIAVNFFPPKVAVPVIVCMLFQQLLAAFHGYLITLVYEKRIFKKSEQKRLSS